MRLMSYSFGVDVGTSSAKVLVIDDSGAIVAQASRGYDLHAPKPGWSEQNPEDWVGAVSECLEELSSFPMAAIGFSGQMHGLTVLDERGEVIRPAMLWNDQRTARECEEIDERVGKARYREITCNPPMTGFQVPKLLWMANEEPDLYAQIQHVLLPKDYVRYRLTGILATDVSDASGTGLLDVPRRAWSAELMDRLGVCTEWLPEVFESGLQVGEWNGAAVAAGAGDQAGAAYGVGATVPGIVSLSLGTSGVVYGVTDAPRAGETTNTFCDANGGWHTMGVMLSCGGALRWYRDVFRPGWSYDQISEEARNADAGCDGLNFIPYLAGERCPVNDPTLRASFTGATLAHGPAHFSRSVFEGITDGLRGCLHEAMKQGVEVREIRVTGGGAKSAFWRSLLEESLGRPCVPWPIDEGPAYGAALLAKGLA